MARKSRKHQTVALPHPHSETAGYIRLSVTGKGGDDSIENQKKIIEAWGQENQHPILQKVFDHLAQYHCSICKSKKVSIDGDDSDENGMVQKCYLSCEKCGSITEVDFEKSSGDSPSYTTGRGVE